MAMTFDEERLQSRLALVRRHVAQPIPPPPWNDPTPALVPLCDTAPAGGGILIAGARHAVDLPLLRSLNVTAVLNCASGVSRPRRVPCAGSRWRASRRAHR